MKLYSQYWVFIVALISIECGGLKIAHTDSNASTEQFQSVIDSIYHAHPEATGIMIHVEAPERGISWSGAVGYSDREAKVLIEADQPALIASNTKTYVAAAILRLAEEEALNVNQPIGELLSEKTKYILRIDEYDLGAITVAHLLSHTSGIYDYVNAPTFFAQLEADANHRWTAAEQITLAIEEGDPLGDPGDLFSYADTNYSLLAEIIAESTGKAFYTGIRELINYKKHGFNSTWFKSLEAEPLTSKTMVHQYFGEMGLNSYKMDVSFDLYGGGGIASSTADLSKFLQFLFQGEIFEKPETLDLMLTEMPVKDGQKPNYYFGLTESSVNGLTAIGHGGFWGTTVNYFPELNTSISVFILERDARALRKDVIESILEYLD